MTGREFNNDLFRISTQINFIPLSKTSLDSDTPKPVEKTGKRSSQVWISDANMKRQEFLLRMRKHISFPSLRSLFIVLSHAPRQKETVLLQPTQASTRRQIATSPQVRNRCLVHHSDDRFAKKWEKGCSLERFFCSAPATRNLLHVQNCTSSEEVVSIVTPYIPSLTVQDICMVYGVLNKFSDRPQISVMESLHQQLWKLKNTMQARDVSHVFYMAFRTMMVKETVLEELAQQSMLPFQMEAFSHADVSKILLSIGCMVRDKISQERKQIQEKDEYYLEDRERHQVPDPVMKIQLFPSQQKFVELLVCRFITVTEYDQVNASCVSNALYGVAPFHHLDHHLVESLVNMAIHGPIFREMTDQGLAGLLISFGYLNFHDPETLQLVLSEITHPSRLAIFSEKAMISTIQGLSLLQYNNRSHLFTILTEALRPWRLRKYTHWQFSSMWYHLAQLGVRESSFLDLLSKEAMHPDRLTSCSSRDLFNILMSMSKIKYRNNDFLHKAVTEITSKKRRETINKKDFPSYVWILGQLQYNNPEDLELLMKATIERSNVEEMPSKTLASIVYGLAKSSIYCEKELKVIWEELAKPERLQKMSEHSLSSLIHSMGRFPSTDCPQVKPIIEEALKEPRVGAYTEYGLAALLYGLTKLKIDDKSILQPLYNEIQKPYRVDAYEPGALNCLLLGLSSLGNKDQAIVEKLALEIVKSDKIASLEDSVLIGLIINFSEIYFENLEVIEKLLHAILERQELRKTTNSNFSAFVYALGELGYGHSRDLLLPIIDEITKRRISFKNNEMASILSGLSNMGIKFSDFYTLKLFVSEALQLDRIGDYSLKEVSRVYTALSLMDYHGKDMEPLVARIQKPETYESLDFPSLACAVLSLGRSGVKDDSLVQNLKREMINRGRETKITEKAISQLIQGIGPMCLKKDYAFGQMLLDLVHYHFADKIDVMSDHNLTAILYGLAQLGIENKVLIYPFIVESIKLRRLQKYNSKALSTLVFALGQFRFRDEKALLPLVQEVCREHRIEQFVQRQLAGNIFSFCNMDLAREHLLNPLLKAATDPQVLKTCGPSDISMLLYTIVKIKPKEASYLQNALAEITRPERLQLMGDQALNAVIFSINSLKQHARSFEVLRAIVDQLCIPGRLEKMNGEILGNIAYSLGRLEYCPAEFADILATESMKSNRLKQFSETALCNIINTFGKTKYENRSLMNVLMAEVMKPGRLPRYHEGHILNIVYALGALRFTHAPFFAFMDRVLLDVKEVDKFQPKILLLLMVSYKLLGQGNARIVKNVSRSIFSDPKRLALLNDVQLSCLMNTLGEIQRKDKSKSSTDLAIEQTEHLQ